MNSSCASTKEIANISGV